MKKLTLPSGAILTVQPAPFSEARALYQAILEELKGIKLDMGADVDGNFFKDLFCAGFSSKKVEQALAVCMKRALYNDLKIDDQTFEPVEAREDYIQVCYLVAKENIEPFMKSLYAQLSPLFAEIKNSLASRLQTTPSSSSTA